MFVNELISTIHVIIYVNIKEQKENLRMPFFLNNSTFAISSSIKGGWVVNKLRTRYNKFLELILLAINYCLEKQKFYSFFIISLYRPL